MLAGLLDKFAKWALSKNAPGGYAGEDGKRWAYVIETDGSPYLTRIMSPRIFGMRVFLHHFHRGNGDQDLHNHPWKWAASLVLAGSYVEERLEGVIPNFVPGVPGLKPTTITYDRVVRFFNFLRDTDYHRVAKLNGDVWTLFVTGPRTQEWGFLVDGKHVDYRTYLGKDAS